MTAGEELFISCLKHKAHKVMAVVKKQWLDGSEVVQYTAIMDYYRDNGDMMGIKSFCSKFKLDPSGVDSRPAFYLNAVKERYIFTLISDTVPKIVRGLKDDPRGKLKDLQSLVATLSVDSVESRDALYSDDSDERRSAYEERLKCSGVTYLSMGIPDMDKVFYGYRKNDLITIGGKAGLGKTWLAVFLAFVLEKAILEREEETGETFGDILFISNEMGDDEIKERIDCIKFKLPYEDFLKGTLTEKAKSRYYKGLSLMKRKRSKIRIVPSCQTIEELSTLMGLYQPSVVFIDGSYLMEGKMQEGWEKIVYITRNLKRLAKNFNIPIVNTTQLKRGANKNGSKYALDGQDDFAYSSSYAQDSDIALRMFQDADMKFHDLIGMEAVKCRRAPSGTQLYFQNNLDNMVLSVTAAESGKTEMEVKDDI